MGIAITSYCILKAEETLPTTYDPILLNYQLDGPWALGAILELSREKEKAER